MSSAPMSRKQSEQTSRLDDDSNHGLATSDKGGSKAWRMLSFETLKNVVADAKGKASVKVIDYIKNYLGNTKLVFVVGQTGSGKTSLLKELTGIDLKEGHGVSSGTLFHRVCPAMIDDDQYLFIDTAGFGAHDVSNDENFVDIIGCLNGLGPFVDIVGLLFVYGGSNSDRLGNDDLRTIQWVQCFCGPNFYSKIVLVTSKWDRLKPKAVRQAWTRMEDLLRTPAMKALHNPSTRHEGATIYHHGLPGGVGPPGEAVRVLDKDEDSEERSAELKSMITRIFKSTPIIKLQVAQELGDNGDWSKTEAAKLLSSDPQSITIEIQANRSVVCYKSNSPSPASYDPDNSTKTDAEPGESAQPSKAASNSSTSLPSSQPRKADEPHSQKKMWYQSLFKWLAVAWAAAAFFQGARAQYQNSTNTGAEGAAQSWFSAWNNSQDSWSDETEEE